MPDSSRQDYMFWSDWSVDTISRAKLDGSEVTVLVNSGLSSVGKGEDHNDMFTVLIFICIMLRTIV